MSAMCACGNPEGTNDECERCELLRVEGVLSRLAMRLVDRLAELGEEVILTEEEAGVLSAFSRCEQKGVNMEPKQVEHSAATHSSLRCEALRVLFEAWVKPQWGTIARYRDVDANPLTYRVPELNVLWDAFNAGAIAVCELRDEQRLELEFE